MGMFTRVCDIVSANIHELIDKFEDPEKMLRQAIREMEATILQAEQDAARVLASEKLLAKEIAHNEQQTADWQRRAEQAVTAKQDDMARRAISRKQEHEKLAVSLKLQLQASQEASQTLRQQLDAMRAKFAEAKHSLSTITARNKVLEFQRTLETLPSAASPTDAFGKFAKMKDKVDRAEAEAAALVEIRNATSVSVSASVAQPSDVDLELAALKAKLAH